MYPLDLEEFFGAVGVSDTVIKHIKESWDAMKPVDEVVHRKLMSIFRLYLIVGGMPAAVQKYLETNNLQSVMEVQKAILRLYQVDITKYDPNSKLYIREIFNLIPPELNAKNKRFILKNLNENIKFSRYENSFIWLKDAGVAMPTFSVEAPTAPLVLSRQRNLFKLFQNDVGLLAASYADGIQMRILDDDKDINFGAIYENLVAQELHCHGLAQAACHTARRHKNKTYRTGCGGGSGARHTRHIQNYDFVHYLCYATIQNYLILVSFPLFHI